jgi:hypothetical protein
LVETIRNPPSRVVQSERDLPKKYVEKAVEVVVNKKKPIRSKTTHHLEK